MTAYAQWLVPRRVMFAHIYGELEPGEWLRIVGDIHRLLDADQIRELRSASIIGDMRGILGLQTGLSEPRDALFGLLGEERFKHFVAIGQGDSALQFLGRMSAAALRVDLKIVRTPREAREYLLMQLPGLNSLPLLPSEVGS